MTLATAGTSPTHAARSTAASWKPVAQERLDDLRGRFDVGAGLQVSFGIERAVYINGALVVATSLTIPDVSRITADQASRLATALGGAAGAAAMASAAVNNALAGNPVTANGANGSSSTGSSSSSTGTSASATGSPGASVTSLPATAIAAGGAVVTTNGALSLIQNRPGNSVASSMMAGTPATVIQNSLNNQSIQNLVTINAGVNTLQAFRAQVANSALNSALQSAASRHLNTCRRLVVRATRGAVCVKQVADSCTKQSAVRGRKAK
ncbi:flagellin [Cupriavidus basilensis]